MQVKTVLVCGAATVAVLLGPGAAVGLADPSGPASPSCNGQVVADINHSSGATGPSGNPTSSSGPGSFLGPDTHAAIATVRGIFC